jgi:hypothetical protein
MPGQDQLSLVRQSPLIDGRFTFQDEVPGSSPGRPTTHRPRSQRCRQRAGRARCRLGPRWGRAPIPAGTSSGPSGSAPPGRQARRRPPTVVAPPAEDASHVAGAATSRAACARAHSAAAHEGRSVRRPGLPGRSRGQARPLRPAPTPAARVRHRPPTGQRDFASVARVPASWTVVEPSTARQPPGPPPVPVVTVARPARPGPQRHRLSGRIRTRPDRPGADSRRLDAGRLDTGRVDSGRLDAGRVDRGRPSAGPSGRRSQVTGHRTAG